MRNLTIKRAKSFVACLGKMKIYIEDPVLGDTVINDTLCRKIGVLKNGEEKTFAIGEQAARVFVVADQLSKGYCNDYYPLPAGTDDVFLSGKNKYNPAAGNAFRFDNNDSAEVSVHRRRSTRKGLLILVTVLLLSMIVGGIAGYKQGSRKAPEPKTFSSDGMTITLTDAFAEVVMDAFTAAYDSADAAVFALKEAFTSADGLEDYTLAQYADLVIQANSLPSARATVSDGLVHFEYTNTTPNGDYRYFAYVYKAADAFWLVQFAVPDETAEDYTAQIQAWAKSVTFSD